jgi:DNA invertase Pin-like site-specific DNA recombinase
MKSVAIYARVSTSDQNAESQLMELRSYCQRRGFEVHREYVDQVTGVVNKRRAGQGLEYKRLMADAKQKRFDVVLVWKFDRFARSLQHLIEALHLFEALGIDFISMTQEIDTTTAQGRLLFQMIGSFAEFEREMIVERVKAGVANARRKGVRLGRPRESSPADEEHILKLHRDGLSATRISRLTGRSRAGIWLVIQRRLDEYTKQRALALASPLPGASNEDLKARQGSVVE